MVVSARVVILEGLRREADLELYPKGRVDGIGQWMVRTNGSVQDDTEQSSRVVPYYHVSNMGQNLIYGMAFSHKQ